MDCVWGSVWVVYGGACGLYKGEHVDSEWENIIMYCVAKDAKY